MGKITMEKINKIGDNHVLVEKEETATTVKGPKPVKKLDAFNKKSKRK